jgi:hypothetical protein
MRYFPYRISDSNTAGQYLGRENYRMDGIRYKYYDNVRRCGQIDQCRSPINRPRFRHNVCFCARNSCNGERNDFRIVFDNRRCGGLCNCRRKSLRRSPEDCLQEGSCGSRRDGDGFGRSGELRQGRRRISSMGVSLGRRLNSCHSEDRTSRSESVRRGRPKLSVRGDSDSFGWFSTPAATSDIAQSRLRKV